jgi:hypothetical protein
MNLERAALIVIITLFVVILFNVGLYLAFRNEGSSGNLVEMLQRASKRAKHPWKDEDEALAELSRRVKELKIADEDPEKRE